MCEKKKTMKAGKDTRMGVCLPSPCRMSSFGKIECVADEEALAAKASHTSASQQVLHLLDTSQQWQSELTLRWIF